MKYLGTLPGEMDLKAKLFVTEVDKYCAHQPELAWGVFSVQGGLLELELKVPSLRNGFPITPLSPESDFDLKEKFLAAQVHLLPCHHL